MHRLLAMGTDDLECPRLSRVLHLQRLSAFIAFDIYKFIRHGSGNYGSYEISST
jgi:hypothetical protein